MTCGTISYSFYLSQRLAARLSHFKSKYWRAATRVLETNAKSKEANDVRSGIDRGRNKIESLPLPASSSSVDLCVKGVINCRSVIN